MSHVEGALKGRHSSHRSQRFSCAIIALVLGLTPLIRARTVLGEPIIVSYSGTETAMHDITFGTAQDQEGVLYFAGSSLLTFDGDHWKSAPVPDSAVIRSFSFGRDGRLWAGTTSDIGWFSRTEGGEWKYRSLAASLPPEHANVGEVWGIWTDSSGTTFVCNNRILRWNDERFTVWEMP